MMIWLIRQASHAVAVAGLDTTGMPARMATATFSKVPQAGKVEGVDVHGDTGSWHANMVRDEAGAREARDLAVDQQV